MKKILIFLFFLAVINSSAFSNEVEIVKVEFKKQGNTWRVNTTLKHQDTGWEHYADAWRIMSEQGEKLGERILFHPHENEQPFTRSLQKLVVPKGMHVVYVEAHDKKHGWSKQRVRVDLNTAKGDRYHVSR